MTKIEIGKQYRTRDGQEVRIYAVDGGGDCPVHGSFLHDTGSMWVAVQWTPKGRYNPAFDSAYDLIEVRPRIKQEVWVNVYKKGPGNNYPNRQDADTCAHECDGGRIACVKLTIDCEEGEGL